MYPTDPASLTHYGAMRPLTGSWGWCLLFNCMLVCTNLASVTLHMETPVQGNNPQVLLAIAGHDGVATHTAARSKFPVKTQLDICEKVFKRNIQCISFHSYDNLVSRSYKDLVHQLQMSLSVHMCANYAYLKYQNFTESLLVKFRLHVQM